MTTSATPPPAPLDAIPEVPTAATLRRSLIARLAQRVVTVVVAVVAASLTYGFVSQLWVSKTPDGHDISHPCDLVRPDLMTTVIPGATPTERPPVKLRTGGTYYSCDYEVATGRAVQIGATETALSKATRKDVLARVLADLHATNITDITDLPDAAAATYTFTDGTQRLIICKTEQSHARFGYAIAGAGRAGALHQIGQLLNATL